MSWIAWIHSLVGACDSDEVTVQDYILVWRGWILWCHMWLGTIVEWEFLALIYLLSVCRCWRFVLDLVVAKASLTFAWCVEMVASWGVMGFLVKVWFMCYPCCEDGFIIMWWYTLDTHLDFWHVIVCSYGAYYLFRWDGLDHVVMFMLLRPWLELWHWSWFSFLVLSTLIIS